ncbi:hypothetical protein Lpp48_15179 [Lacticaseibacillus paracasei subsp. paracasei Lpp48]|nr:hypothetical protein Lpp48_15179 [Lacticaseibacillus paracasei subsp. paracasei Lpp48]
MKTKRLSPVAVTSIVLGVIVAICLIFGIGTYNSLAKQNQAVEAQWGQVENVMQRRADLVPNLVNAVKGNMGQEQKVFGDIAEARKSYANASSTTDKAKADDQLNKSVGTLINVIKENYPTLQSSNQVNTLMTQLEGSENRISVERKRYIDQVRDYNQSVVTFPKNIFASMMGLGKKDTFKATPAAQTVPSVDFQRTALVPGSRWHHAQAFSVVCCRADGFVVVHWRRAASGGSRRSAGTAHRALLSRSRQCA